MAIRWRLQRRFRGSFYPELRWRFEGARSLSTFLSLGFRRTSNGSRSLTQRRKSCPDELAGLLKVLQRRFWSPPLSADL